MSNSGFDAQLSELGLCMLEAMPPVRWVLQEIGVEILPVLTPTIDLMHQLDFQNVAGVSIASKSKVKSISNEEFGFKDAQWSRFVGVQRHCHI